MAEKQKAVLTRLEREIMEVLWRLGPSSVHAVQEALPQTLAYTTVQTMLNILERKRQVGRERQGRAFVYNPVITESNATGHALRDFVDRIFGGSSEELVMSLVKRRHIDPQTLAELARKLGDQPPEEEEEA